MRILATLFLACALTGCATTAPPDLAAFRAAAPRSILVVPIVNKSLVVSASEFMLTTLPVPLAERGYYVFPVETVRHVLESEGFYEPDRVHQQGPANLAKFFDADAVLLVTINRWQTQYLFISATVTVEIEYRMFNRAGAPIWDAQKRMVYSPQQQSGASPLAMLISAAVSAALLKVEPNYLPLARQANQQVIVIEPTALPTGPYVKPGLR
ncbi:MAG: GNA1162 family protein [Pseudomonadota bacterium]